MPVPGAFELPLAAMALAKTRRYACIVALGAIVRGETPHFDYVAAECASGLQLAGDRDRRAGRLRRADGRHRRAGGGADRRPPTRCARRSRWPTCSPGCGRAPAHVARYTAAGRCRKICAICGKKPAFGNNRSHSMVATKRRFDPNLQRVRMLLKGSPTARLRLHPLPQGRQGHQSRLAIRAPDLDPQVVRSNMEIAEARQRSSER